MNSQGQPWPFLFLRREKQLQKPQGTGSTVPIGTLDRHEAMRQNPIHPPFAMPYFRTAATAYSEQVGE
jgi:hypothetical protein